MLCDPKNNLIAPTLGVSGAGVLFKVRFRGVGAGTTAIAFANASLRSASNQELPASFLPGVVTVQ